MDIYSALKEDHQNVSKLLDQLVACTEPDPKNWKALVQKIRDELIPHSRAEEAVFYNPIRESAEGKKVILHAYGEHATAEAELRALQAMDAIDVKWVKLAQKLRTDLLHHVAEEESKVFSLGKTVFSDNEARQIAAAFNELKPFIKNQSFVGTTVDLVANLLPDRLRKNFGTEFVELQKKVGQLND